MPSSESSRESVCALMRSRNSCRLHEVALPETCRPAEDVCSVCVILDALRTPTPSLCPFGKPVPSHAPRGCEAPIRHIHLTADRCIVSPPQLLWGVSFNDALRQVPALTHFTLQHCRAHWQETDAPPDLIVEMPHLTNFVVHADSPRFVTLLNDHLSLPKGAKR
jgi:hypothetical protein